MAVIASVQKEAEKQEKEEKNDELGEFLQACILEIAVVIYFKFVMLSPLVCRLLHRKFGLVQIKIHGAMNFIYLLRLYSTSAEGL